MTKDKQDKVHGEGNYKASREYNDATKEFVESGRVGEAARQAEPSDSAEAREMERAEQEGRSHAKEEDPSLKPISRSNKGSRPK
ncbi:MAG TPA: hypothetical protein VM491_18600 [Burkholderiaceae bacterium]|nr:hypothetical protein [Burkholderiaceae bacterium]